MQIIRRNIGINIRFYREQRGFSQSELASRAMVSRRSIQNIENGSANPSVDFLASISVALNVTFSDLFGAKLFFRNGLKDISKIDFYGAPNSFFTVRNNKDQIIEGNLNFEKVSGIKLCDFADNMLAYIGRYTEVNFELITEKHTLVLNRSCADIVGQDFEKIGRFGYGFRPGCPVTKGQVTSHFWQTQARLGKAG